MPYAILRRIYSEKRGLRRVLGCDRQADGRSALGPSRPIPHFDLTSAFGRLCSLIPGLGVKLSTIILAGPTVHAGEWVAHCCSRFDRAAAVAGQLFVSLLFIGITPGPGCLLASPAT